MAAIHGRFTRSQILIQNGMALGDFVTPSPSSENWPLEPPLPPPASHAIPSPDRPWSPGARRLRRGVALLRLPSAGEACSLGVSSV